MMTKKCPKVSINLVTALVPIAHPNWTLTLARLCAVVRYLKKPRGWRTSEYAATKATAGRILDALIEQNNQRTLKNEDKLSARTFDWSLLLGEIARYWQYTKKDSPAQAEQLLKLYWDLRAGLYAYAPTKTKLLQLQKLDKARAKQEKAAARYEKLARRAWQNVVAADASVHSIITKGDDHGPVVEPGH